MMNLRNVTITAALLAAGCSEEEQHLPQHDLDPSRLDQTSIVDTGIRIESEVASLAILKTTQPHEVLEWLQAAAAKIALEVRDPNATRSARPIRGDTQEEGIFFKFRVNELNQVLEGFLLDGGMLQAVKLTDGSEAILIDYGDSIFASVGGEAKIIGPNLDLIISLPTGEKLVLTNLIESNVKNSEAWGVDVRSWMEEEKVELLPYLTLEDAQKSVRQATLFGVNEDGYFSKIPMTPNESENLFILYDALWSSRN